MNGLLLLEISEYVGDAGDGCVNTWSCCGLREEVKECEAPQNKRWTCCNKGWVSEGCTDITKEEKLYECCKKASGAKGCIYYYPCCGKSGKGCTYYWPCCNQGADKDGCTKKCPNCKRVWGAGPGCVEAV